MLGKEKKAEIKKKDAVDLPCLGHAKWTAHLCKGLRLKSILLLGVIR